jgi:hypothetical protein
MCGDFVSQEKLTTTMQLLRARCLIRFDSRFYVEHFRGISVHLVLTKCWYRKFQSLLLLENILIAE